MTRKNIIGQYVYTAREYVAEFPQMRGGDIFMGAFNAEQVMYNHFGYRTPVGRLYMAGSAAHPGGAISGGSGYISAGIIARDLGLKLWWKPWDARRGATRGAGRRGVIARHDSTCLSALAVRAQLDRRSVKVEACELRVRPRRKPRVMRKQSSSLGLRAAIMIRSMP